MRFSVFEPRRVLFFLIMGDFGAYLCFLNPFVMKSHVVGCGIV